jgi:hypothetical protein
MLLGEITGIGMGCAIAGALVTGVIVCLLLRRSRQPNDEQAHDYDNPLENGSLVEEESPVRGGLITNVDVFLPQPADDNTIVSTLSKIRDDIKNHTQN